MGIQTTAPTAAGRGPARPGEAAMTRDLRASLLGEVIDRTHPGYDAARRVWNGVVDRFPAVIARCSGTADVVAAVAAARRLRPPVSIRGGGHQVAGSAVCQDGMVIDLSAMRGVHVDPAARTVRAQAGARWADVDRATQLFGLAVPGGEVSQTGIAGFTLGGGMGLMMRAAGLACDNLRSIEIVTADGAVRTASPGEYADLFWAARGGGRGLGVVTSFEFGLRPLGPQVAAAQVIYPYQQARDVLRAWRDLTPQLPDTVSPEIVLWSLPPDPGIPEELHGSKVVLVAGMYAGPAEEAGQVLAPLTRLGIPLMDLGGTMDYVTLQSSMDELFPAAGRYFFKSHFLDALDDDAIETMLTCDRDRPTPQSLLILRCVDGAVNRVNDTAYPHRGARYNLSIDACWSDPAADQAVIGWARSTWTSLRRFSTGGVYVNFAGLTEDTDGDNLFGASTQRLDRIRQAYDPTGLFGEAARTP
jgi:hypothetical protein